MQKRSDKIFEGILLDPDYRIIRHLLLVSVLALISVEVFFDDPDHAVFTWDRFILWIVQTVMLAAPVYLNVFVLTPKYMLQGRGLTYILSVLATIVGMILLLGTFQLLLLPVNGQGGMPEMGVLNAAASFIAFILLFFGTSAIVLMRRWILANREIAEVEAATLNSELKFLKKQINPHFLFNMLNNAHLLVIKQRPEATEVLLRLEDMLRYQINDSAKERVSLAADIAFIRDFLDLEKIRRDNFVYTVTVECGPDEVTLPPLLFIPFIENAVKHSMDGENLSRIEVRFTVAGNELLFLCRNTKPATPFNSPGSGGIGLKNIGRRLELLYPARHELSINDSGEEFTVELNLKL